MGREDQGVDKSAGRYTVIPRVLCFITTDDEQGSDVLLLRGAATKRIWPNRYNGVGGHVERDEDVYSAAIREAREETGLDVTDLRLRGVVNIDAGKAQGILMFVFTAKANQREVIACAEGSLEWWPRDNLPQSDLVDDLTILLPRVLSMADDEQPFSARYWYDDDDRLHIDFSR